jgi:N-acetylneuraminate synthase
MVKFIADIAQNHNGSLERALKLADIAKEAGCWAIKPQLYEHDKIYKDKKFPKIWEFKREWISKFSNYCRMLDLKVGYSMFYKDYSRELDSYADFYKISSFDAGRDDLIFCYYRKNKPLFISAGLFPGEEIRSKWGNSIRLHCLSKYPAKVEELNLWLIKAAYIDGYSDHSREPGVIYKAVGLGAKYIEFHLDLDGNGNESKESGHCWLPYEITTVINNVRIGEKACQKFKHREDYYNQKTDPVTGVRN